MPPSKSDAPIGPEASWRRSSRCGSTSCVEIAMDAVTVRVRDSKHTQSAVLTYDRAEWTAFIEGVKAGEFDLPQT